MNSRQKRVLKRLLVRLGGAPKEMVEGANAQARPQPNWILPICLAAIVDIAVAALVPTWKGLLIALAILLLFAIYPVVCVVRWAAEKHHLPRWAVISLRTGALVIVLIVLGCWAWVKRPPLPLIVMEISPSSLPMSIPANSVASVLQVHPYIGLTAEADGLLKIANNTGKEGCWPSPKEMGGVRPNGHESVYRFAVSNHSPETLESGKLDFGVIYNTGYKDGTCVAPSDQKPYQIDTVLLPALDSGKSFEFLAVNQSDQCAWLIPPASATVIMGGGKKEAQVPLVFDKSPLYAAGAPIFPATSIQWEGVPTKPRGYGIIRAGSFACE